MKVPQFINANLKSSYFWHAENRCKREPLTTADVTTANVSTADVTTVDVLVLGYGLWVRVWVRP